MMTFDLEEVIELLKEYDEQNVPLKLWLVDKGFLEEPLTVEYRLERLEYIAGDYIDRYEQNKKIRS